MKNRPRLHATDGKIKSAHFLFQGRVKEEKDFESFERAEKQRGKCEKCSCLVPVWFKPVFTCHCFLL